MWVGGYFIGCHNFPGIKVRSKCFFSWNHSPKCFTWRIPDALNQLPKLLEMYCHLINLSINWVIITALLYVLRDLNHFILRETVNMTWTVSDNPLLHSKPVFLTTQEASLLRYISTYRSSIKENIYCNGVCYPGVVSSPLFHLYIRKKAVMLREQMCVRYKATPFRHCQTSLLLAPCTWNTWRSDVGIFWNAS